MKFIDLISEKEIVEASVTGEIKKVKKIIEKSVSVLYPEAFNVEKASTDAGLGGINYIKVTFNGTPRSKDMKDIDAVKKALDKEYNVKYYEDNYVMAVYPSDVEINEGDISEFDFIVESSSFKKSTWKKFIEQAKIGLQYNGSTFSKTNEDIQKIIEVQGPGIKFSIDRELDKGVKTLRWKGGSVLDKSGKVWEFDYKGFTYFIIEAKSGSESNHIIYRFK